MHYSKDALRKMAQDAAEQYLVDDIPMTDSISKLAATKDLNREQVSRVCAYANHAVNAELMKKQAYTTFELADPDAIWPTDKEGGFIVVPEPQIQAEEENVKTASGPVLDTFRDLAATYGVEFVPMGDDDMDVRQLLKAADKLSAAAYDNLNGIEQQLDGEADGLFNEVKNAILAGIPFERIVQDMKEDGALRELEAILPRLEAEFLIPASAYDDDGPYSQQRAYKQADVQQIVKSASEIDWQRGTYFKEAAARVADLIEQARLDVGALLLCEKVAHVYADQDFMKVAGPYRTMVEGIEKRAVHPVTRALGRQMGKLITSPFRAIGRGASRAKRSLQAHSKNVREWKDLNSPFYMRDGGGTAKPGSQLWSQRTARRSMTDKPRLAIQRVGAFAVNHPIATAIPFGIALQGTGAMSAINSKQRIHPL